MGSIVPSVDRQATPSATNSSGNYVVLLTAPLVAKQRRFVREREWIKRRPANSRGTVLTKRPAEGQENVRCKWVKDFSA